MIQAQLEGCKRNREVFEKISRGMAEATYQRSTDNVEKKLRNCVQSTSVSKIAIAYLVVIERPPKYTKNSMKFWDIGQPLNQKLFLILHLHQ